MAKFPQRFGPYTLHELIARGGMAEVYRATMPGAGGFEKTVAIKKILPHLSENEEFIAMLVDEARIIVGLNHANIAQVYDLGCIDDTYYIAMEYVHSVDLADIIKESKKVGRTVPVSHAVYIASCVCAGLHVAHRKSDEQGRPLHIVHRDVSPHNVLISFGGDVKVIDFGVAKARGKETQTKAGVIKGKLLYMAPEQAMAKEIDGRADLFAVGIILYNMLTNRLPFDGDNEFQIYNNILACEVIPPRAINPGISEGLNQIIMMMLQRDPDKRYQDGYACKVDLDRVLHAIAPGYSINRLSAWVEDSFLPILQARRQRKNNNINLQSPQTPSNPMVNHTGPASLIPVPAFPPMQAPAWPAPSQTPSQPQGWGPTQFPSQTSQNFSSQASQNFPAQASQSDFGGPHMSTEQLAFQAPLAQPFQTQVNADQTGQFAAVPRKLPILPLIGSLVATVLIGAMVIFNLTRDNASAESVPGVPIIENPEVLVEPDQIEPEVVIPEEPQTADVVPNEEEVAPVAEEVDLVKIAIQSNPSGAKVLMAGEDAGVTPLTLELPRAGEIVQVEVSLEGYEVDGFGLVLADDTTRLFELKKIEVPAEPPIKPTIKTVRKTTPKKTAPKEPSDDPFSIPLLDAPKPAAKKTPEKPTNQDDLMNPFE